MRYTVGTPLSRHAHRWTHTILDQHLTANHSLQNSIAHETDKKIRLDRPPAQPRQGTSNRGRPMDVMNRDVHGQNNDKVLAMKRLHPHVHPQYVDVIDTCGEQQHNWDVSLATRSARETAGAALITNRLEPILLLLLLFRDVTLWRLVDI
jgi:hypothetical protein